ncbi:transcriptional repressor LexA [Viridibacillus arvi]|uniref:transcriptional repressor LexA n=1 Tax=Viridibacillus arvi TaxID=263475 RepID=UPI0034CECF73
MYLTPRQREVLDFINKEVQLKGYPPSVREIGKAVGLSSSASVHSQLAKLEEKGFIRKDPIKSRTIEVINNGELNAKTGKGIPIPLVDIFSPGQAVFQSIKEYLIIPEQLINTPIEDKLFLFQAKGNDMLKLGILDGDYVLARQQQVALNGELVVSISNNNQPNINRLFKSEKGVYLTTEESAINGVSFKDIHIAGKVIGVHRKLNKILSKV